MTKIKESDIQAQIISYLSHIAESEGIIYFAIPNEGFNMAARMAQMSDRMIGTVNTHLKKIGMLPGVPDLCILHKGQTYFIEVKTPDGKLSARQTLIHKAFNRAGFTVYIARSVDDVESILRDNVL